MPLTVLIGGARSGKSALAIEMAKRIEMPTVVVVTGSATDDEMAERIRRHRADRPRDWETIEEPLHLSDAIQAADGDAPMIVDCLTLWVANAMEGGRTEEEIDQESRRASRFAADRPGTTIAVTNEVGSGIVPMDALARRFRDVLGRTNQVWAEAAERTLLMVAGRVTPLSSIEEVLDDLRP